MKDQPDFDEWVATVRDPAERASEGKRTLRSINRQAGASYELASLPDGRFAIKMRCDNRDLALGCTSFPWQAFSSREECLRHFVETASAFFSGQERWVGEAQRKARAEVLGLLSGGLFGFVEPEPIPYPTDLRPYSLPEENSIRPAPPGDSKHHG